MNDVNVAVLGCGRVGSIHAQNFQYRVRGARLIACVDPSMEQMQSLSRDLAVKHCYSDYRIVLEDPDVHAVVIAAPTEFHRDIAVAAAEAGKHILCEKPLARNIPECREILTAAQWNRVKLQVGFMRRFDKSFCEAKSMVDSGAIGDVVMVRSLTYGPSIPKAWMYDISQSNGPLSEVNSHDIDTLRWYTGSEFREVYAIGGNYRCHNARDAWPDFYDNVVLAARFHNGMQGCINGAQGVRYGYDARCEILGTSGIIFTGALEGHRTVQCTAAGMSRSIVRHWTDLFAEAYQEEDQDFIRCILDNDTPRAGGVDGLMAVRVVNAGNSSIKSGTPVLLDEMDNIS